MNELDGWLQQVKFSKVIRNRARDFSDGVLMSQLIHHFRPKLVDLHNYEEALKVDSKIYNWNTLNSKAFKPLKIPLDKKIIEQLANSQPGVIDQVLLNVKSAIENPQTKPVTPKKRKSEVPIVELPMSEEERNELIEKIYESDRQKKEIQLLKAKISQLTEICIIKDAKILRSISSD